MLYKIFFGLFLGFFVPAGLTNANPLIEISPFKVTGYTNAFTRGFDFKGEMEISDTGRTTKAAITIQQDKGKQTKKLGQHWIMDIGVLDRFQSGLESGAKENRPDSKPFLIEAEIEPGQIDLSSSLGQFLALPQENEINLKYQPKKFKIENW